MIKLIAFDWNGTLLADTKQIWVASNYTFKKFGLKPISLAVFKKTYDIPMVNFYTATGMTKQAFFKIAEAQSEVYHPYYEKLISKARSRGGAKQILTWLKEQKINAIIYSNHTNVGIATQLKRLNLNKFISHILANDKHQDTSKTRRKEAKLFEYIKSKGYKPHEVVSVGDTCEEVEIGKSLGLHTIAISGGSHSIPKLKAAKPDFLIHNLKEIKDIISKLTRAASPTRSVN